MFSVICRLLALPDAFPLSQQPDSLQVLCPKQTFPTEIPVSLHLRNTVASCNFCPRTVPGSLLDSNLDLKVTNLLGVAPKARINV